jgi:hypothetical protein
VAVPYDRVKDTEVSVTDADYEKFLDENPHLYDQTEETRVLAYARIHRGGYTSGILRMHAPQWLPCSMVSNAKSDSTYVIANNGTVTASSSAKHNCHSLWPIPCLPVRIGDVGGAWA